MTTHDSTWLWLLAVPTLLTPTSTLLLLTTLLLLSYLTTRGGPAWASNRAHLGPTPIPGPRGLPILGSLLTLTHSTPHRVLASLSRSLHAKPLMAFSIASTPAVVSSDPSLAKEILSHPSFSDRPLKRSARELLFSSAIGFAPNGTYWRLLRRVAASHLFSPRRIAAFQPSRRQDTDTLISAVEEEQRLIGSVRIREHLQFAALNNVMGSVFGRKYGRDDVAVGFLRGLVREGFELLGAFNWSDHVPWLHSVWDPNRVSERCAALVPRVRDFVVGIIEEHEWGGSVKDDDCVDGDFVDVLLSLEGDDKLSRDDMVAVLWEMIFRGTDTTALLTEWALAELILNPHLQSKLRDELDTIPGELTDADVARLPYLQAVIKETLRVHPPGPLLSWARLSTSDVQLSNGMVVPAQTTAMVNMWSITHDPAIWPNPDRFDPDRFIVSRGGEDVDVRGGDLRLAPFGAGRRVCPGKNLGLVTVGSWLARLVSEFEWAEVEGVHVDLTEVLKLSCEMKNPLVAKIVPRVV